MECPEELGKALILPLTIQPLLENAIRYGMEEMMDTCEISIRTRKEGTLLIVEVSNEGSVFEDSLLEKLQDGTKNAHGFGIGLVNIHQRIQMLFGIPMDCPLRTRMRKLLQSSLYHTKQRGR